MATGYAAPQIMRKEGMFTNGAFGARLVLAATSPVSQS